MGKGKKWRGPPIGPKLFTDTGTVKPPKVVVVLCGTCERLWRASLAFDVYCECGQMIATGQRRRPE
jgi:hypothetical protein